MTLKEYANAINKLLKENPEAKNFQVVSSSDEEGNCFNPVFFEPSLGFYEEGGFNNDNDNNNAVCIN